MSIEVQQALCLIGGALCFAGIVVVMIAVFARQTADLAEYMRSLAG